MKNYSERYLEAVRLAAKEHALQTYGSKEPYYKHLKDVEQVLIDHNEDDEILMIAANCHDLLEDTSVNYSVLKEKFGVEVAEIVYLCTDNKGRNRKSRKNEQFYLELSENLGAIKIKVADRIANVRCSVGGLYGLEDAYKKEYYKFKEKLFKVGHIDSMWAELDKLLG